MKFVRFAVLALGLLAASSALAAEGKGGYYGLQLTNGTADLYSGSGGTIGSGVISAYDHSEVGAAFQYWRLMGKDYAFTMSVGVGTFSETDKPGTAATVGTPDFKYTQSSWSVRVGGDRAAKLGDRAIIYFGPGIEYWSGKAKFDNGSTTPSLSNFETESVTRISLACRLGGVMMLNDMLGLNLQIGHYIGSASATDNGAKANWIPSGFQAACGVVLRGK